MVVNQKHSRVDLRQIENVILNVGFEKEIYHFSFDVIFLHELEDFWLDKNFFGHYFELLRGFDFFINEEVCIFLLFLIVSKGIFLNTSKTFIFHLF